VGEATETSKGWPKLASSGGGENERTGGKIHWSVGKGGGRLGGGTFNKPLQNWGTKNLAIGRGLGMRLKKNLGLTDQKGTPRKWGGGGGCGGGGGVGV